MPLIALKCPQCGADLKIDDSRDSMFCEFCGAKVIREQNIVNNITVANGIVIHDAEWYYNSIAGLIRKNDFDLAKQLNDKFANDYPLDDRYCEIGDFFNCRDEFFEKISSLDQWINLNVSLTGVISNEAGKKAIAEIKAVKEKYFEETKRFGYYFAEKDSKIADSYNNILAKAEKELENRKASDLNANKVLIVIIAIGVLLLALTIANIIG